MSEKAQRAKWREELIELQSMIEPVKNEEIARRAIHIAWACLEKAENQAMMLQIYQDKQRNGALSTLAEDWGIKMEEEE